MFPPKQFFFFFLIAEHDIIWHSISPLVSLVQLFQLCPLQTSCTQLTNLWSELEKRESFGMVLVFLSNSQNTVVLSALF